MMPRPGVRGKPLSRIQLPRSSSSGAATEGATSSSACMGHPRVHTRKLPLDDRLQGSNSGTRLDPRTLGSDNTPTGRQGAFHPTTTTSPPTLSSANQASTSNLRVNLTVHATPNGLRQWVHMGPRNSDGRPEDNGNNISNGQAGWKRKRRMAGGWGTWKTWVDDSRLPSLRRSSSVPAFYSTQAVPYHTWPNWSVPAFPCHGEMPGQSSVPLARTGPAFNAPFAAHDNWLKYLFPLNFGIPPMVPPQWLSNMNMPTVAPFLGNPGVIHGHHNLPFVPPASNAYPTVGASQPAWRATPARPFGPVINAAVRAGCVSGNFQAGRSRSQPKPDVVVFLWKKDSTSRQQVLAMFDSGNRFAPLMALETALSLGFRSKDFSSDRRVLQSIGGVELLTAGTIKVRYYVAGNFDRLHETDFHILEQLAGDYEVNLPTEKLEADPKVAPIVAATVAKKRAPTDVELRLLEDRIRQVEDLAVLAEKERAMRKAAEREKREKSKAKAKHYP